MSRFVECKRIRIALRSCVQLYRVMNKHDYGGDGSTEHQHAFRFVI